MSQELGTLVLELRAEVAQFKKSMADASATTRATTVEMRNAATESRHAFRLLNEEFHLGISRSMASFLNTLPGVSSAMSLAFAPFAIAGLAKVLVDAGSKLYEFAKSLGELSKAERARHDQVVKDAREELQYQETILKAHYALAKAQAATPQERRTLQIQEDIDLANLHGDQIKKLKADLDDLNAKQTAAMGKSLAIRGAIAGAAAGAPGLGTAVTAYESWRGGNKFDAYQKEIEQNRKDINLVRAAMDEANAKGLEDYKRNAEDLAKEGETAAKKAARLQMQTWEETFAALKADHVVTLGEEGQFWAQRLALAANYPENYKAVQMKVWQYTAEILKSTQTEWTKFYSDAERGLLDFERKREEEELKGLERFAKQQEERGKPYAELNKATGQEVANRIYGGADRAAQLEREMEMIRAIAVDDTNRAAIEGSIRDINRELAGLYSQELLASGNATDGMRAFFNDMVHQAQMAGEQVYQIMRSLFEGLNSELARAMTGQKTSFARMFQGLAGEIAQTGLKSLESTAFGALAGKGGVLGSLFGGLGGKPDGTASNPMHVIIAGGLPGIGLGPGGQGGESLGIPGFMGSILHGLIPGFAEGGDVYPGQASMVGERGPELFMPSQRGSIVPMGKLGTGAFYNVNVAAGVSREEFENTMQHALVAVHGSAVKVAYSQMHEMARRVPRGQN